MKNVFEFFKLMEQCIKPVLSRHFVEKNQDPALKDILLSSVKKANDVQVAWLTLPVNYRQTIN